MPARVVFPAAVPICVIVAPPLPLPGYGRLHADSGRRAGPAGRWRVSTSGAVRRAALASTGSGEGVPVVDVGLRSRHRKPRCVCGETAPSRSTSERRIDRTIGLPLYIVGPVSWRPCARGGASRPATLRRRAGRPANAPRPGAVRRSPAAGGWRQGSLLAAMWSSAALSEMQAATEGSRWRRRPAHRGVQLFFRSAIAATCEGRPTGRFRRCGRDRGGGEPRRGNLAGRYSRRRSRPPTRPAVPRSRSGNLTAIWQVSAPVRHRDASSGNY